MDTYCLYHASKFSYLGFSYAHNNAGKLKLWLEKSQKNNEQLGTNASVIPTLESHDWRLSERSDSANLAQNRLLLFVILTARKNPEVIGYPSLSTKNRRILFRFI